MKLGRLPRGLVVAAVAAVTVVPLAASAASAAPAAPTAYTVYGSAQPLSWAGSSSLPVGDLHVPAVVGKTNNFAVANSYADLANPDETSHTMSGEAISGLACTGYEVCKDPFNMIAKAAHSAGPEAGHGEQAASFGGKDGKFPGHISAVTDCPGNCGDQIVRSVSNAAGPAGGLAGYVSIGSSSASHDLNIDDKGRLISTATSELDNVSIGPKNEVHFSRLVTTSQAFGSGAENTKDGRADLRIADFFILDNPVELTRAGLRLANGGPSEQEAYDGAKVLLQKLKDRGITLELPNFDAQLVKTPDHVTVDTQGLRVRFEQNVGTVNASAPALNYPLELGHATAVVVALDINRNTDVNKDSNGGVVVQTTGPTSAPVAGPPAARTDKGGPAGPNRPTPGNSPNRPNTPASPGAGKANTPSSNPGAVSPAPSGSNGEAVTNPPADPGASTIGNGTDPAFSDPTKTALPSVKDLERNLGLRGAHSVSRAFGAFFGLGLILPLARFLIRRLG
ncbi:MAG TPA: hypothetical protein VEN99_14170 [Acidimicrobiia bacterium]|nr:hypothetical protein [Acidimicrobiia bacterium]